MKFKVMDKYMDNNYKWHVEKHECANRERANELAGAISKERNVQINAGEIKDYQTEVIYNAR